MTPARACGTIRTVRASTNRTSTTTTAMTIQAITTTPSFVDERRCALDLGHLDQLAGLEHLLVGERPRRPHLAADLDPPAGRVDALQNGGLRADERGRTGAHRMRHAH